MIEAWKIGVSLAMTSNASQVLGALGRDLFGLGTQAKALTGQLGAAKLAAMGAMGVVAGGAAIMGMVKLVEHGRELVHQQALFKEQFRQAPGMTDAQLGLDTAEATAQAYRSSREILTSNVAENLKSIRELVGVFGDLEDAKKHATVVIKAQSVMQSLLGEKGGTSDQVFALAKALEIKGTSMDPAHFERLLDLMVKASVASGGKVLGTDFFGTFKYGRTATLGWSDEFVGSILPTLIQEMKSGGGSGGAGGPGNALMSAFQAVVGGVMSNKSAQEFVKLGLVNPRQVIRTTTGSVKGIQPGGVAGAAEFQANPYAWTQEYLVPALKRAGIVDPERIREEVAHLFGNRTAQQIITMFATQQMRFEKDAALNKGASGLSAYDELIKGDPTTKIKAFHEAWHNLVMTLGAPLVNTATDGLLALAKGMNVVTEWAANNKPAVEIIGEVAFVLAGLAVAAGTLAIGTAAATAMAALVGPAGFLLLLGGASIIAAMNIERLYNAIQNFLPGFLQEKRDAAGKTPLENMQENPPTVPWWFPGPAGPGGRAPGPWSENPQAPNGVPPSGPIFGPQSQSGSPLGSADAPVHVFVRNGRDIARGTSNYLADQASKPMSGGNAPDPRLSPLMPGQAGLWAVP